MKKTILLILAIITCIFLVGCGEKNQEIVDNGETEVISNEETNKTLTPEETEKIREEELENTKKTVESMELYSDDSKYVFKTDDNTTGIFYHNGNEITGYEIRVTYDSHELAEIAKAEYLKESEDEDIKSINVSGNELIVQYGPKEYEDLTLDAIKMTYSMFQVLKDGQK